MREIPLINSPERAKVDDEDYPILSQFKWELHDGGAVRWVDYPEYGSPTMQFGIWMHHEVLVRAGNKPPKFVPMLIRREGQEIASCEMAAPTFLKILYKGAN